MSWGWFAATLTRAYCLVKGSLRTLASTRRFFAFLSQGPGTSHAARIELSSAQTTQLWFLHMRGNFALVSLRLLLPKITLRAVFAVVFSLLRREISRNLAASRLKSVAKPRNWVVTTVHHRKRSHMEMPVIGVFLASTVLLFWLAAATVFTSFTSSWAFVASWFDSYHWVVFTRLLKVVNFVLLRLCTATLEKRLLFRVGKRCSFWMRVFKRRTTFQTRVLRHSLRKIMVFLERGLFWNWPHRLGRQVTGSLLAHRHWTTVRVSNTQALLPGTLRNLTYLLCANIYFNSLFSCLSCTIYCMIKL